MRTRLLPALLAGLALALGTGVVVAQGEDGASGVVEAGNSGTYEVSGISVDVSAKTAEAARLGGWRLAQRKAWTQLASRLGGGGAVSDGTLSSMVAGIVVENEQIGPTRYIARLGVLFNRARAGALLGISAYGTRSPPMLVVPVQWSGGVGQAFEARTEWQQAWARFRAGGSSIDYVRPGGSGPDALLLNVGQTGRPGRGWWRTIIDMYGASDILIPTVRLYRQWPGGPVIGVFQARHGPDNGLLGSFALRVGSAAGVPQLLDTGVKRMDALYQRALSSGYLIPDVALRPPPSPDTPTDDVATDEGLDSIVGDLGTAGGGIPITVQYDTPNAGSVTATEAALGAVPGVRSAVTTSLALGGVSLMRVTYDGDPALLRTSLEARGYQVVGNGQTIRIRRAPTLLPPDLPADNGTAG